MNFKEAFDMIGQTYYEREYNITIKSKEIFYDGGDIKLIKLIKSTGEFGLCIIYKTNVKNDNWAWWYPSKNQIVELPNIIAFLIDIDNYNSQYWRK